MTTYVLDARTVTPHFPGIGRYVANLAPALAAQLAAGERLLVLHAPEARERLGGLAGPRVRLLATSISPFSLGQQLQLPRLLRETGDVDLYHSTYYLMPYSMRLPTVLTFYDLIPLQHPETVSRRARLMFRMTMGMALGVSAHVVSISEAARRDVLARFKLPPERITTTALASDARFCPQPPDEVARVRAAYNLPQEMVLFVGINKPHKNLVRLIEAFGRLLQKGSSATLVIAGPWDDRYPEAKVAAASMPGTLPGSLPAAESVRFLGPVADADLPALYAAATVFVLPSLYEGFGLPVLEAMACGAAVVCSSTSSLPEIAGEAALTFDPQDVEAMAEAIGRLLGDEDLRQHMAQAGLVQAASFTWEKTAALTLAVYRQVLEQAGQGK
jgi:glycosyltransferase involved in cell wall biosynthesis